MDKRYVYVVDWADSASQDGWQTADRARLFFPAVIRTVGFLLSKSEAGICIAQGYAQDDQVHSTFYIPSGCITKVRKVKV